MTNSAETSVVHGLFVGIDKHEDPVISELGGCVRDAQALSALFCDSIERTNSTTLLDEQATKEAIEARLSAIEVEAGEDDVVVVSFAGHGTDSHRFVCFNTTAEDVSGTTIGMGAISQLFANCQARVILVLLDCCFSGGAAARVWETGVATRSGDLTLSEIAGNGRVILTASRADEEAIEDPGSRHGLFTSKLIDLFVSGEAADNPLALFGEVQNQVRVAAQQMGHRQNPRFLGEIDPSFRFPKFVKGELFAAYFPDSGISKLSGPLDELVGAGISQDIVDAWIERFPSLNSLQLKAVNDFGILQGKSVVTIAPTSSGKTFIGELAAAKALVSGQKVAVLLPYKALVNEKFQEFEKLYGGLGYRVTRSSGDWQDQNDLVLKNQYDIAFFTYETFLNFVLSNPHILERIGLIVLDEAQFIADQNRGIVVELILTALVAAKQREITPQLVSLSAVIGDTNRLEEWLGASLLRDVERPVPLIEGVLNRRGEFHYLDTDGNEKFEQLLSARSVVQRGKKPSSQDVVVPLVSQLAARNSEKVLIFRNTRGSASGSASYLARDAGIAESTGLADEISTFDRSARSDELVACVEKGVAFHTSDLTREERGFVENSFRSQDVTLNALVATTTVAAGVNTPASSVVIVETEFYGANGPVPYTVSEYKNMAGRAGRLGFEASGRSILLAESDGHARQLFNQYVLGKPEAVHSSFKDRDLDTWAIKLLAQVSSVAIEELSQLLMSTFGAFSRSVVDPGWPDRIKEEIPNLIERFSASGLIEQSGEGSITLTPLGTSCGRASFSIKSALALIQLIDQFPDLFQDQELFPLALLTISEVDERFVPLARGRDPEAYLSGLVMQQIPALPQHVLRTGAREITDVRRRCKKALILKDWMLGVPVREIETRYSANFFSAVRRGDIVGLADTVRFHLSSVSEIVELVSPNVELGKVVEAALFQLEFGLPLAAKALVEFPVDLTRGEILTLMDNGIVDFSSMDEKLVSDLLGIELTKQIAQILAT